MKNDTVTPMSGPNLKCFPRFPPSQDFPRASWFCCPGLAGPRPGQWGPALGPRVQPG